MNEKELMELSDDKKLEEMGKLSNDFAKASIIVTLHDNKKQQEELEKLNDEFDKAIVVQILQKDERNLLDDRSKLKELLLEEEERKIYRERYNSSSKILEQTSEEKNPFRETKFSKVDFKKKHSLGEFHDVAISDRIESTNDVTMETVEGVKTENVLEKTKDRNMEEK